MHYFKPSKQLLNTFCDGRDVEGAVVHVLQVLEAFGQLAGDVGVLGSDLEDAVASLTR